MRTGRLTKAHMHSLFKRVFPGGDSESFCDHIYRIFDSDGNGYLDFKVQYTCPFTILCNKMENPSDGPAAKLPTPPADRILLIPITELTKLASKLLRVWS